MLSRVAGLNWRLVMTPQRMRQIWYVPLLVIAMGVMLVRMLVMARLLDIAGFAQFSGGLLVSSTFGMLGCLGLQSMLQRDLPMMIVDRRERPGLVLLVQCLIVACGCGLLGLIAAAAGLSIAGVMPSLVFVGVLHGVSQQVFVIATVESRSRGEPLRFAIQNLVRALAVIGIGIIVAKATNSAIWCLAAEALVSLAVVQGALRAMFRRAAIRMSIVFGLAFRRLWRLQWRSAMALLSVGMIGFVLLNVDRWLATKLLSVPQFAQYSFAWMVLMVAQSLQVVINASAYPLLARRFASFGKLTAFSISMRASAAILISGGMLAIPVWLLMDASIARWFSAYEPARTLLPFFLAIAVLRVSDFWSSFMVIVGLEARLLWLNIGAALIGTVLWLAITLPWRTQQNGLETVGLLAVFLTLSNYLVTAVASWHASKR